jgi:hypothetical protein
MNAPPSQHKGDLTGSPMCSSSPPPLLVDPLSLKALDNDNNHLAMGESKAGSGWQERIINHTTKTRGSNERQECVADDYGSLKEGEGGKGDGDNN